MNKIFNIVATASAIVLLGLLSNNGVYADTNVNTDINTNKSSSSASAFQGQGNAQNLTIENPPIPTSTSVKMAPALTAPGLTTTLTETCLGSVSGGISIMGGAVTGGSTIRDDRCGNRLDARELKSWGETDVAKEVMCGTPEVKSAYKRVGRPCMEDKVAVVVKEEHHINDGMKNHVKTGQ